VKVVDGLASVPAGVDDHAVAIAEALGAGDPGRGLEQMAEQRRVLPARVRKRGEMPARSEQHVYRRLRIDVRKCVTLLVLVDGGRGDASLDDLAEEAVHVRNSVQERHPGKGGVCVEPGRRRKFARRIESS
jgi:hypothetical protein